jgi:hypothetical protein
MAPKYRSWLDQNTKRIEVDTILGSDVRVDIQVWGGKGWRMNRDLDNIFKGVLDLLVKSKVIVDDCTKVVTHITAEYCEPSDKKDLALLIVKVEGHPSETQN